MNVITIRKYRDESWDFRTADTKKYTHSFHAYPAMMIPQVAGRILDEYGVNAKILFDPYCGTGTSLVEANIRGINAIGTDINPLARLIARAKTTVIPLEKLDKGISEFNNFVFYLKLGKIKSSPHLPVFPNIDYWFKKETQYWLAIIRDFIEEIKDPKIKDFFKVAFSETVREASLTRNSEFKLYRMTEKQIKNFNPEPLDIMTAKLIRNRKGLEDYIKIKKNDSWSKIYDFNSVFGIPPKFYHLTA